MQKTQRFVLTLLSMLLLSLALTLAVQNMAVQVPAQFLTWSFPQVSLGLLLLASGLLLGGSTLLKMADLVLRGGQKQRQVSREMERKDVTREEAEAKVKVLENKVETLEKALKEALRSVERR